jgi:general stress protein 26
MDKDAVKKAAAELMKGCQACVLVTVGPEGEPRVRPMAMLPTEGPDVWFATSKSSRKMKDVAANPKVAVYFERKDDYSNVVVTGRAEEVTDEETKRKLWKDDWKTYWPDGPGSPDYALLKVTAQRIHYMDSKAYSVESIEL